MSAVAGTPQHRLPSLSSIFPQGARPGGTIRVEVLGHYLDRTQHVVFLDSSLRGRVISADYTRLALELEIGAKAAHGPHYFRVVSPRGASNVLLFRIGDLPHVEEKEPNSRFEEAQTVPVPSTINGQLNVEGDFDFFRFRAGKGQTLVFDVRSARNGSGLDPALILLDSRGRKLDHSEERFIWDPMLVHTFAEAGEYVAVIQPSHTALSQTFGYQFDIRTSPYLESVSPISVRPGNEVTATLFGEGIPEKGELWFDAPGFSGQVLESRGGSARVTIRTPQTAQPGEVHLAWVTPQGRSNQASFLVDGTPQHPGGNELRAPVSVTSILRYREPEQFFLEAAAGETLLFEVRAQRFGSPVDPVIRIFDAAGKRVAMNDDGKFAGTAFNKDPQLIHTFKEAGRFRIEVRNLWKLRAENVPYQLLVRRPRPRGELEMATDNPYLYPGETATLRMNAVRNEAQDGPISIELTGLNEKFLAETGEVRPYRDFGEITVRAGSAKPGDFSPFEVKQGFRFVRISGGGGEGATSALIRSGAIAVAEKPHFSLEALASSVNLVRGGSADFRVAVERAAGFADSLRFEVINLPPGIRLEPALSADASGREVILKLTADQSVAKGWYSRVAALGKAASGEVQLTPLISIVVE